MVVIGGDAFLETLCRILDVMPFTFFMQNAIELNYMHGIIF